MTSSKNSTNCLNSKLSENDITLDELLIELDAYKLAYPKIRPTDITTMILSARWGVSGTCARERMKRIAKEKPDEWECLFVNDPPNGRVLALRKKSIS